MQKPTATTKHQQHPKAKKHLTKKKKLFKPSARRQVLDGYRKAYELKPKAPFKEIYQAYCERNGTILIKEMRQLIMDQANHPV